MAKEDTRVDGQPDSTVALPQRATSHTEGPWKWFNYPDGRKLLSARTQAVIHCPDGPLTCGPEDASLISAAPDLLAACVEFVRKCENGEARSSRSYAQMKAAIAKAEGR